MDRTSVENVLLEIAFQMYSVEYYPNKKIIIYKSGCRKMGKCVFGSMPVNLHQPMPIDYTDSSKRKYTFAYHAYSPFLPKIQVGGANYP